MSLRTYAELPASKRRARGVPRRLANKPARRVERLKGALVSLPDARNGPPPMTWEAAWSIAMEKTAYALAGRERGSGELAAANYGRIALDTSLRAR